MKRLTHCNEEQLLAYLDGELRGSEAALVREHLAACWRCRATQAALEQQIRNVAERFERLRVPSPDRIAEAKIRLSQRIAAVAVDRRHFFALALFKLPPLPPRAAIAACAALAVMGFGAWYHTRAHSRSERDATRPVPVMDRLSSPPVALSLPWLAAPAGRPLRPPAAPPLPGSFRKPADATPLEVEVCYALHRIRACLNEAVTVIRQPDGRVIVTGLVSNAERKSQILATLGELKSPGWLVLDLGSPAETIPAGQPSSAEIAPAEPTPAQPEGAPTYFADEIRSYFRERGSADVNRELTEFMEKAVLLSDALLSEAWALRRLAERFPDTAALHPRLAWLVEVMVRDHLTALREQARTAGTELCPVLAGISVSPGQPTPPQASPESMPWQKTVIGLFENAQRIRAYTTGLFAGAGLPLEIDQGRLRVSSPYETLRALQAALRLLEAQADGAASRLAAEFSAKPKNYPRND